MAIERNDVIFYVINFTIVKPPGDDGDEPINS
jgi:hypothetical protein